MIRRAFRCAIGLAPTDSDREYEMDSEELDEGEKE